MASLELQNGGIKVILTRGRASRGLTAQGDSPNLLFQPFIFDRSLNPISLHTSSWRRDAKNPIYKVKSINYLEAILGRREALAAAADEILFFNLNFEVTETAIANMFIIKNNQVFTPPPILWCVTWDYSQPYHNTLCGCRNYMS